MCATLIQSRDVSISNVNPDGNQSRIRASYLSDELHDLREVLFFLQDLVDFGAEGHEVGEVLLVVVVKGAGVLGVRDQPGFGQCGIRQMFRLNKETMGES